MADPQRSVVGLPPGLSATGAPPADYEARIKLIEQRMAALGRPVVRTSQRRTAQQQAALYSKGRTRPGSIVTEKSGQPGDESRHQLGEAVDFAFVGPDGRPSMAESHPWQLLGETVKTYGLEWGGDWTTLKDRPHAQLSLRDRVPPRGVNVGGITDPTSIRVTDPTSSRTPAAPLAWMLAGNLPAPAPSPAPLQVPSGRARDTNLPAPAPSPAPSLTALAPAQAAAGIVAFDPAAITPSGPAVDGSQQSVSFDPQEIRPATPTRGRYSAPSPLTVARSPDEAYERVTARIPKWQPGPIPAPPQDDSTWSGDLAREAVLGFDPTTREGRRNLAGAAGAAGVTAGIVATAPVSLPGIALGALGAAGAMAGGASAELGEQLHEGGPLRAADIATAGAQQGVYEVGGQVSMWPLKAFTRRLLAMPVSRATKTTLGALRLDTVTQLETARDAVAQGLKSVRRAGAVTVKDAQRTAKADLRDTSAIARAGRETARQVGRTETQAARDTAAGNLRAARAAATTDVRTATEQAAAQTAAAAEPLTTLVGQSPETALAGRQAWETIAGPSTDWRNALGQQVNATAAEATAQGHQADLRVAKTRAQAMLDTLRGPLETFPRQLAEEEAPSAARVAGNKTTRDFAANLEKRAAAGDQRAAAQLRDLIDLQNEVKAGRDAARAEELRSPVVQKAIDIAYRILNAEDTVPFDVAHAWKQELQNELQGTYDKAIKKRVERLTQHLAGGLREALTSYQPYTDANAAYAEIVPLFTKEFAAKLRKDAQTYPEHLVQLFTPRKPTAARMMRDVLLTGSAEGGQPEQGRVAWDTLRDAWVGSKFLTGGIDKLEGSLDGLDSPAQREFRNVLFGDPSGASVLQNLRTIAASYRTATEAGATQIAAAKQAGALGLDTVRTAGKAQVTATSNRASDLLTGARTAGRQQVEQTARVGESRITQAQRAAERNVDLTTQDLADAQRALVRYRRTPTTDELAYMSSTVAQRQLSPEQAGGDIIRLLGLGPFQIWGGLSAMRLLRGPKSSELIRWAAYSRTNTSLLTKLLVSASTGASPTGLLLSDVPRAVQLLRMFGPSAALEPSEVGYKKPPTPAPSPIGQPPPSVPR